ncbi:MAG TPA: hypothetical protein VK168_16845 [Saprospiraceae bacterium]|nr:hypothetical protein [Saprospiraceae bacterium]
MRFSSKMATLFASALLLTLSQECIAQQRNRSRDEKDSEEKGFTSKLWYGGGVNIGFGGYSGFSSFNFGLSPMVGYKIIGPLSVGPRLAYDFTSIKQRGFQSLNLHSFDLGGFVRCRVFRGLFLQGEISNQWFQNYDPITGGSFKDQRVNQRIGGGWNFGSPGGTGSEISILYNFRVANDLEAYQNPVEYRFGFTWKF